MDDNLIEILIRAKAQADVATREVLKNLATIERALKSAGDASDRASKDFDKIDASTGKAAKGLGKLEAAVVGAAGGLGVMAGQAALGAASKALDIFVDQIGASIDAASNLQESMTKSNTVFGENAAEIEAWSETSAEAFGQSQQDALEAASTFAALFRPMGIVGDEAANMSVELVELASDLASFNNIGTDEALEKLRAGLVGEVEPLRTLGVQLSAAAVEAKALELGLADSAKELTTADKAMGRYFLILEQTTVQQGNYADTADDLANVQRRQAAQSEDLQATLGQGLLPVVTELNIAMNDLVANPVFQSGMGNLAQGIERTAIAISLMADGAQAVAERTAQSVHNIQTIVATANDIATLLPGADALQGGIADGVGFVTGKVSELGDEGEHTIGVMERLAALVAGKVAEAGAEAAARQDELNKQMIVTEAVQKRSIAIWLRHAEAEYDWVRATDEAVLAGHRHNQMLAEGVVQYDAALIAIGKLGRAQEQLAGLYQTAAFNAEIFNTQSSEYGAIASDLTRTYDILNERKAAGRDLTGEEIRFLEDYEENLGRAVGGQEDATVQAGLYRTAQVDLMQAQDELNEAIKDGEKDLGPYQQAVADAEGSLNDAATASGGMRSANDLLTDIILTDLLPALRDIVTALQEINDNPATAKVDADTSAAQIALDAFRTALANNPLTIDLFVNAPGNIGLTSRAGGGPIKAGELALVGEEGPELIVPRGDVEVLSNAETQRMLALMSNFRGGFAVGTGAGKLEGGGGGGNVAFDAGGFVGLGEQIAAAIALGVELGLIESGTPTGLAFARAIIEGATKTIEVDGADGVTEAWVVAMERIPELAASIGSDTVIALLQEYANLQGELQLAILSGEDTGQIQAQLDALFAIFAAWSGNAVTEVEAVWAAIEDEQRAEAARQMWEDVLGSLRLPQAPVGFDLESLISGEALEDLNATFMELWDLQRMLQEAGFYEEAALIGEKMKALGLQQDFIESLLGTDFAQKLVEEMELEKLGEEWDARMAAVLGDDPLGFAETLQESIDDLQTKIDLGPAMGVPQEIIDGWAAELAGLQGQQDQFWGDLATLFSQGALDPEVLESLDAAGREQLGSYILGLFGQGAYEDFVAAMEEVDYAQALEDGLVIPTAETLAQLEDIFRETPEVAVDMIDDLLKAVQDGRLPFEDAMRLLALIPEEDLIPALENLDQALTVDLAEALLKYGPDSPEVQAILAGLELIEGALESAGAAADAFEVPFDSPSEMGRLPGREGSAGADGLGSAGGLGGAVGVLDPSAAAPLSPGSRFGRLPGGGLIPLGDDWRGNPNIHIYIDGREITSSALEHLSEGTPSGLGTST